MISATSIEILKSLTQCDYNTHFYDFHNDYSCEKLCYSEGELLILFKSLIDDISVSLKFTDVKISTFTFFNVKEAENLTLDTLYRGRAELEGELIEMSEDGRGYFYLEFYEGQKLEFWAKSIVLAQE